jgi:hypothetical protein
MFESKFGKKFGSKFAADRHSADHSEDGTHMLKLGTEHETPGEDKETPRTLSTGEAKFSSKEATAPEGNPEGMNMEEGSPENEAEPQESRTDESGEATNEDVVPDDVKSDAQAHGAASKVTVTHDHAAGRHMVTSQHKDGHLHTSEHKTAGAAHASARHLGGVMPKAAPEPEDDEYSHLLN